MSDDPLSLIDYGGWAEHYASRPWGHYKAETYPLFAQVLATLPEDATVLDIGAGPAHLELLFLREHTESRMQFTLLDSSAELLKIAEARLADCGDQVQTVQRSFNSEGWGEGLGKFDAIVSNNALFHLKPRRLKVFYQACADRLKRGGVLLNQQAFAWQKDESPQGDSRFAKFIAALPQDFLNKMPDLGADERDKLEEEKEAAVARHHRALEDLPPEQREAAAADSAYQWLTSGKHLEAMRTAGLEAGEIWRKREFAVLLGLKP